MHRSFAALVSLTTLLLAVGCSSSSSNADSSAGSAGAPQGSGQAGALGSAGATANGGSSGGSANGAGSDTAGSSSTGGGGGQLSTGGSPDGVAGETNGGAAGTAAAGSTGNAGTSGAAGSTSGPTAYPTATTMHRAIGVHDPSMIQVDNTYYLFATGGLLGFRSSTDLATWKNAGSVFSTMPSWIATELGQTITDLWAPDVSYDGSVYRVYYAGSTFGSNHSVIGLATNTTLDSKSPNYKWVDQGLVIESNKTGGTKDNWNAIDPNFIKDEDGNSWLVFGSFWSGIQLRQLDPATGKLSTSNTTQYSLANNANGVEAASIVYHGGYYYLFVSYDACCKGVNSTYRTMVGRAASITGPYSDNAGKPMLQGNALQLLATDGRYIGPGGGTAFRDGALYYYAYHYYDGQANGASFLMMRGIGWTSDGWPMLMDPLWE